MQSSGVLPCFVGWLLRIHLRLGSCQYEVAKKISRQGAARVQPRKFSLLIKKAQVPGLGREPALEEYGAYFTVALIAFSHFWPAVFAAITANR